MVKKNETRYSGKVGVAADLTDSLGVYGELSAITATDSFEMDDLGVGGKLVHAVTHITILLLIVHALK